MGLKITGLEKAIKKFEDLPDKVQKKVIRQELTEAMEPMKSAVEANAPVGATGKMRNSVVVKNGRGRDGVVSVLVSISKKEFDKGFYPSFVELGKKGFEAEHFMKKAFDAHATGVRDAAIEGIKRAIDEIVERG